MSIFDVDTFVVWDGNSFDTARIVVAGSSFEALLDGSTDETHASLAWPGRPLAWSDAPTEYHGRES